MFAKVKQLFTNLVIYGLGDVATTIISFFLLPIYVRYLSPDDYGVLSLLLTTEVVTKILFRWGIDASFMRLYYDCADQRARQLLASTQIWFLLVTNGTLLAIGLLGAPLLGHHLFHTGVYTLTLRLVLINTFVIGFYFVPFHVMRIEEQPRQFIALGFSRSLATLVLRLVFVIVLHYGVLGVVLADIAVTAIFTLVLARWFVPLVRFVFSRQVLNESLRFGLPRVPHGVAHQIIAVFDRYILGRFVTLHELGLYSIGASFGLAMKLFLSAFEYAWAPFYFGLMKEPDAKETFSRVTTYGIAVLALLAAGLSAIATRSRGGHDHVAVSLRGSCRAVDRAGRRAAGRVPAHIDRIEHLQTDRVLPDRYGCRGGHERSHEPAADPVARNRRLRHCQRDRVCRPRRRILEHSRTASIRFNTNTDGSRASSRRESSRSSRDVSCR